MFNKNNLMPIIFILILAAGCSSGVFTRMDSSAPSFGPLIEGMTRSEAELHLGDPVMITVIEEGRYQGLYRYEKERAVTDTVMTDMLDILTLGMGNLIIKPTDRFKGCEHLIAILYQMEDQHSRNDRIVKITDRVVIEKE